MNFRNIVTRRNVIVALVVFVVGVAAWLLSGAAISYLSQRDVTFTLAEGVSSIVVTNNDAATDCSSNCPSITTETLTASGKVRLPDGTYSVTPSGDSIVTDRISITVTKEQTAFTISPDYSTDYLSDLYSKESPAILSVLKSKYPAETALYRWCPKRCIYPKTTTPCCFV